MEDVTTIDWELWIKRQDQPPFFNSLWSHVEGIMTEQIIGGGFSKQLCIREGHDNWFLRSRSDFNHVRSRIRSFVNNATESGIDELFACAESMRQDAQALLAESATYSNVQWFEKFEFIIHRVENILLYTTSVPYFMLDMIESSGDVEVAHRSLLTEESKALRAVSLYRDIKLSVLDTLTELVGKEFDVPHTLSESLTVNEMRTALGMRQLPIEREDLARREHSAYWDIDDRSTVFSFDRTLIARLKKSVAEENTDISEIRGATAFSGKVTGTVKIVLIDTDMHKMRQGDVLVASSTNPVLTPAIKIASAIVTDEGGIGSHAAIISRELKKPCIIGTKIATQVLKDGDVVEVDADNGVVRVIERKV